VIARPPAHEAAKSDNGALIILGLSFLGAFAFGAWQQNFGAGIFMFIVLLIACCVVDTLNEIKDKLR